MGIFNFFLKQSGLHKLGNTRNYDTEFSTEMYDKTFNTSNMPPYNPYSVNGIHIEERADDRIRLSYDGLLAKSGADGVYAVVGFGDNSNWKDVMYYPMQNTGYQSFEVYIPQNKNEGLNIAFKDSAYNWDNNTGANYTFNHSFYGGSR